jgi:hypothetical protein
MNVIVAYALVVILVRKCFSLGGMVCAFPVALLLAWAPMSLRMRVSGACHGIAGVTLAVAFGYGIFRLVVGPGSFTIGAFLASTLPLLLQVRKDILQSRKAKTLREELIGSISKVTGQPGAEASAFDKEFELKYCGAFVVGDMVGLALATVWYCAR